MSETAKHETLEKDASSEVIAELEKLDVKALSFIQLKRLQRILGQATEAIESESARRAEEDSAGDTVKVPSPNL